MIPQVKGLQMLAKTAKMMCGIYDLTGGCSCSCWMTGVPAGAVAMVLPLSLWQSIQYNNVYIHLEYY